MLRIFAIIVALVAGLLAAASRLFRRREVIDWEEAPRPGRLVDVDGVGVHVVEQGAGPALVLIHGFGGHTFSFRHNIPDLARDFRVLAVDLKGFGFSERPRNSDYSLSSQAELLLGVMEALKIERASLLGHSMGGEVAMRAAAAAPGRVEKLILAASVSGERFPRPPTLPIIKPFLPAMARFVSRGLLRRAYHDPANLTEEVREGYTAPARIRGSMDGLYQIMKDTRRDKTVDYGAIKAPVLIMWPEGEKVLPRWSLKRLQKRLPKAQLVTVPAAGHLLLEERAEECNRIIREYLQTGVVGDAAEVTAAGG